MDDRLFISYASDDKGRVLEYLRALEAEGLRVWIDQTAIEPSDELVRRINDGIAESKYAVLFYSTRYAAKSWTKAEHDAIVAAAIVNHDRKVFVVRLDDTKLPPLLEGKLYFNGALPTQEVAQRIANVINQRGVPIKTASAVVPPTLPIATLNEFSQLSIDDFASKLLDAGLGQHTKSRPGLAPVIECFVHGVGSIRVHLRQAGLTSERFMDFESVAKIANTHRTYLGYLRDELAKGGLGVFTPAYRIRIDERSEMLAAAREQLRDFLIGFVSRIFVLESVG